MKMTPIRREIVKSLTGLNDQLCFFLFLEYELIRRLSDFGPAVEDAFVTDVFSQNTKAVRIHVRLREIHQFQAEHRSLTLLSYFSTSYEVASKFFSSAAELLCVANGLSCNEQFTSEPERKYVSWLQEVSATLPQPVLSDTMTYCRYRRNAHIHRHEVPSVSYSAFVASSGANLNSHWRGTRESLDFTIPSVGPITEDHSIVLIKLMRIVVEDLDRHLASTLIPVGVGRLVAEELFSKCRTRMNSDVALKRARRLAHELKVGYGATLSPAELDMLVRCVGVR